MSILKLPGARIRVEHIVAIERFDYEDNTFVRVTLDVSAFAGSCGDPAPSKLFAVPRDEIDGILDTFERLATPNCT